MQLTAHYTSSLSDLAGRRFESGDGELKSQARRSEGNIFTTGKAEVHRLSDHGRGLQMFAPRRTYNHHHRLPQPREPSSTGCLNACKWRRAFGASSRSHNYFGRSLHIEIGAMAAVAGTEAHVLPVAGLVAGDRKGFRSGR